MTTNAETRDIIDDLRSEANPNLHISFRMACLLRESADEIERLREDNERLREALEPFGRVMIPPELPDALWTTCHSYEYDISEDAHGRLRDRGVKLESSKIRLQLWIDGHPLSDFRRARAALSQEKP